MQSYNKFRNNDESLFNKRTLLYNWISKWPGQVLIIANQSLLTR